MFTLYILIHVCLQSIEELEAEMLNGQKLQGPMVAMEIHKLLKEVNHEKE